MRVLFDSVKEKEKLESVGTVQKSKTLGVKVAGRVHLEINIVTGLLNNYVGSNYILFFVGNKVK